MWPPGHRDGSKLGIMRSLLGALSLLSFASGTVLAQQVDLRSGWAVETVQRLRAGQYVWVPQVAPSGPVLLIVNAKAQRAMLYRNGVPIGGSTVSTGKRGYSTPTGVFTILQKHVEPLSKQEQLLASTKTPTEQAVRATAARVMITEANGRIGAPHRPYAY